MTNAIQEGYYLNAMNPSDDETLIGFAEDIGLVVGQFEEALNSETTNNQLQPEITLSRQLGVQGFPALVVISGRKMPNDL